MKRKNFLKKFVRNFEQEIIRSKNRGLLSELDVIILEDCLELLKEVLQTQDEEQQKMLLLEVTKKFLLLTNPSKFGRLID